MNRFGRFVGYFLKGWYEALRVFSGTVSDAVELVPTYGGIEAVGEETVTEERARRYAMLSAWAWSDIEKISGRVSAAVPDIVAVVDGDETDEHEVLDIIRQPNGLHSGVWFARYVIGWYLLRGNGYAVIVSNGLGEGIEEILPVPSYMMRPIPESLRRTVDGSLIVDYYYSSDSGLLRVPGEYVLHWRTFNPTDYWEGLSVLTAAMNGMKTDYSQAQWVESFFSRDNAVPAAIVSVPATVTPELFAAIRKQVREDFGGRRRTAIVRAGDLTVETIQQTLEQMQILESRQFSRREIDRAFGIPEGLMDGALSGDSREATNRTFARDTVQPILNHYVEVLSGRVRLFYPDVEKLVAPNVVPQDRMLLVQEYRTYALDRTINENREELGLPRIDHPLADIPVRVLTLMMRGGAGGGLAPSGFGVQNPDAMTAQGAGKDASIDDTGAEYEAWAVELDRWRRMALGGWKRGEKDAWKAFRARYLPESVREWVGGQLERAENEADVRDIFSAAQRATGRVLYVRGRRSDWRRNALAASRLIEGGDDE